MKKKTIITLILFVCLILIILYFVFKREGNYEEYLGTTTPLSQLDNITLSDRNNGKDTYEEDLKQGQINYEEYKNHFMDMYSNALITYKSDEVSIDSVEFKKELSISPDYDTVINYCTMMYTEYWLTDYPVSVEFVKETNLSCYYLVTLTNGKIRVYTDLFDGVVYGFVTEE